MNHKENPTNFLHYWWFRYLMATELYIVEKWEQATIRECLLFAYLFEQVFNIFKTHFQTLSLPYSSPVSGT